MDQPLHVEIIQKKQSCASTEHLKMLVNSYLSNLVSLTPGASIGEGETGLQLEEPGLAEHVQSINICDIDYTEERYFSNTKIVYHVYTLDTFGAQTETIGVEEEGHDDEMAAARMWPLPSAELHGLWESLVYDTRVKEDTVYLVETAMRFAESGVNPNIVNWNKVVLFHGPPGTGKTSLCRALAQKLSIRLRECYTRAQLVEVNSHSLFSKWFSESGKLVVKLFDRIRDIVEDRRLLVCILIDEVESLAHSRENAASGAEPSDSVRVVNAMLTEIDRVRKYPNVLLLVTSNVQSAIDTAFADRADIKQYVGLPSERGAYTIYHSCLSELMRTGHVVPREKLFTHRVLSVCQFNENENTAKSLELLEIARLSRGLSGRALRRLPLLAHALHSPCIKPTLSQYLLALRASVERQISEQRAFSAHNLRRDSDQ